MTPFVRRLYQIGLFLLLVLIVLATSGKTTYTRPMMTVADLEEHIANCWSVSPHPNGHVFILSCGDDGTDMTLWYLDTYTEEFRQIAKDYYGPESVFVVDTHSGNFASAHHEVNDGTSDIMVNWGDAHQMGFTDDGNVIILTQEFVDDAWRCDGVCLVDPLTDTVNCHFGEKKDHYLYEAFAFRGDVGWVNKPPGGIWTIQVWSPDDGSVSILSPLDPTISYGSPAVVGSVFAVLRDNANAIEFFSIDAEGYLAPLLTMDGFSQIRKGPDGLLYGLTTGNKDAQEPQKIIRFKESSWQEPFASFPLNAEHLYWMVFGLHRDIAMESGENQGFYYCQEGKECVNYRIEGAKWAEPLAIVELADGYGTLLYTDTQGIAFFPLE